MKYTIVDFSLGLAICISAFSDLQAQWVETTPAGGLSCISVSGSTVFVGGGNVYSSTNSGTSWGVADSGLTGMGINALALSGTTLYAGTSFNGVLRSTNNGTNWSVVNNGLPQFTQVNCLAVSDTSLFAGTNGAGVFLSTNNGELWEAADSGLTNQYVFALSVSGTNVLAGGSTGVFLSSNNGRKWTATDSGLTNLFVNILAVSDSTFLAGTDSGVFVSTTGGRSWRAVHTGLPQYSAVTALASSGTNLFAGVYENGIFLSTNNGTQWNAANAGLTIGFESPFVYALAVCGTDLFAVINGAVWRRPLSEMTSVKLSGSEVPIRYSLSQNYPNPFNPTTTIRYTLPTRSHVTLTVYNALGQQVAILVNQREEAGDHDVRFDGNGLASGIYFYRIVAGDLVQTKKLVILR